MRATDRIARGAPVTWSSSSNGTTLRKTGTVVGFLPAWTSLRTLIPDVPPSRIQIKPSTYESGIDRYVVKVGTRYYCPRASTLERSAMRIERLSFTLCEDTGLQAHNGECPEHGGDACLRVFEHHKRVAR